MLGLAFSTVRFFGRASIACSLYTVYLYSTDEVRAVAARGRFVCKAKAT